VDFVPGNRIDAPVLVQHEKDVWHPGFLEHWRRRGDRWEGFVRYTAGVGMQHIAWVDQDDISPRPAPDGDRPVA
jgi:hypothetical protein